MKAERRAIATGTKLRTLLAVVSGAHTLAACALPEHIAERKALQDNVAKWTAESQARAAAAASAGAPTSLYAGAAGMTPMPTVPFSEAPAPKGGPGWYCYEIRTERGRAVTSSSACARTLEECRTSAARRSKHPGGSVHDPASVVVGTCNKQDTATCMYLWDESGGGHTCFAASRDCVPFPYTSPGAATKQSECGEVR